MSRSKKNDQNKDPSVPASNEEEITILPVENESLETKKDEEKMDNLEADERVDELERILAECQEKANEYLDGWQRARAEFTNYKRRIEREQAQVYQTAAGSILKRQLEVLDDLDRALANRPEEGDGAGWAEGIELIYRKLFNIIEGEGVKVMDVEGKMFDPNMHEAISSEDHPEFESGQVIEVLQKGYQIGDRVLRPALVRVAR